MMDADDIYDSPGYYQTSYAMDGAGTPISQAPAVLAVEGRLYNRVKNPELFVRPFPKTEREVRIRRIRAAIAAFVRRRLGWGNANTAAPSSA